MVWSLRVLLILIFAALCGVVVFVALFPFAGAPNGSQTVSPFGNSVPTAEPVVAVVAGLGASILSAVVLAAVLRIAR